MIKLAKKGYMGKSPELVVDITVKNNPDNVLSPTWDMVMDFRRKRISWEEYKSAYMNLLRSRWAQRKQEFITWALESERRPLVLVCYCEDETRCHRSLAKEALEKVLVALGR